MGDTCLCGASRNPDACAGFTGNNAIHDKKPAEGLDLGITIPFPGSVEIDCRHKYEAWIDCIRKEYPFNPASDGNPEPRDWIRQEDGNPIEPTLSKADHCSAARDKTFATCKNKWINFDAKTRGVYALWKEEEHPVPKNRVFTKSEVVDYYTNYRPYEFPTLSVPDVPQTWIQPYDDIVSELGLNWLHMMYQWALPCWYGLPWAYLGSGGPTASGYPIAGNIPDLKKLCKAGFTSEDAYNVRCEDGMFGEATDTNNAGKCGAAYGQTWGVDYTATHGDGSTEEVKLIRDPPEYLVVAGVPTPVLKGGACCTETNTNESVVLESSFLTEPTEVRVAQEGREGRKK